MQVKLPKDPYRDILFIATGFLVLHFLFGKRVSPNLFLYISVSIAGISVLSSFMAGKIIWAWYKLAQGLGFITSRILLSTIFFIFLTPLAFLYRMRSKDTLQLRKKADGSYFTQRDHEYVKGDLEKMW